MFRITFRTGGVDDGGALQHLLGRWLRLGGEDGASHDKGLEAVDGVGGVDGDVCDVGELARHCRGGGGCGGVRVS